ncbi:MAG: hypothetical protein GYA55_03645 [SAR324 cluster bacterium]|uniref:Uncharacterized protein n=1 Tax=SAR324 cluster bacterium TaxID=2024889 RepID=A0A7X9FQ42_9DELT|nr:hypothetical protein [SAR324 cluster bacterium]
MEREKVQHKKTILWPERGPDNRLKLHDFSSLSIQDANRFVHMTEAIGLSVIVDHLPFGLTAKGLSEKVPAEKSKLSGDGFGWLFVEEPSGKKRAIAYLIDATGHGYKGGRILGYIKKRLESPKFQRYFIDGAPLMRVAAGLEWILKNLNLRSKNKPIIVPMVLLEAKLDESGQATGKMSMINMGMSPFPELITVSRSGALRRHLLDTNIGPLVGLAAINGRLAVHQETEINLCPEHHPDGVIRHYLRIRTDGTQDRRDEHRYTDDAYNYPVYQSLLRESKGSCVVDDHIRPQALFRGTHDDLTDLFFTKP